MEKANILISPIRPLPYYNIQGKADEKRLASALRSEFVPKIKRLLPGHHLGAFRHDTIVNFIRQYKAKFPCFIRTDISRFYPSIRHRDLIVGCQVAYRDLLGMEYVPKSFKKKYVWAINLWCRSLPLPKGIPLGSPLSAILAPLLLIPLWLEIRRRYRLPLLVFMDDILVCTHSEQQSSEIYAFIVEYLHKNYDLEVNIGKTVSGRFATDSVIFCGWRFAGGYAGISEQKVQEFKERITGFVRTRRKTDPHSFFKLLNRKIDGFGHYYKYGDVKGQFRKLDMFIREQVRYHLGYSAEKKLYSRLSLKKAGLHSLEDMTVAVNDPPKRNVMQPKKDMAVPKVNSMQGMENNQLFQLLDKMNAQLIQMVALQRKQLKLINEIMTGY